MMRLLNLLIICCALIILMAFFMPWIKGTGSIVKPIEDTTRPIQKLEPTGAAEGTVKIARGVVDVLTETVTPIKLNQALSGYQIPLSKNKEIKKIGSVIYLLYLLPLLGISCAILSLKAQRKKRFNFFSFLIAAVVFVMFSIEVQALDKNGLFIKIESCIGYWLTLYSFLAVSLLSLVKIVLSSRPKKA